VAAYKWALELHLLPFFAGERLDAITPALVDRYKAEKLREGRIAADAINKTLKVLAMIIDQAIEYEIIDRANPARGRKRRVKATEPARTVVQPEQIMALLDAAPRRHRVILATLVGAGLRVGELRGLNWRDLDLGTATLTVQESKTPTGRQEVVLPSGLVTELWTLAATSPHTAPGDPVFISSQGTRQTPDNIGRRLKTAIKKANVELEAKGIAPISERVTPHSLRRTYASLRFACGDDPVFVAEQGGWKDPAFALKVYAKAVRRRERLTGGHLAAFDAALDWAQMGTNADERPSQPSNLRDNATEETAA